MDHDCVETKIPGLIRPFLPVLEIPCRATAQEIMPIKNDALGDERGVGICHGRQGECQRKEEPSDHIAINPQHVQTNASLEQAN